MEKKRNIIVAVTGASGSLYARLLCRRLAEANGVGRIALIVTRNGLAVSAYEDDPAWMDDPRFTRSMGMAGRIAAGVSNDLASRAADVMLKERRRLILVPREAPLGTIHLRNLTTLSECGAVICPAAPSFYPHPRNIEDLCGTIVERVLTLLDVEVPHYEWGAFHPEPDHQ